jgi:hypothetical protein
MTKSALASLVCVATRRPERGMLLAASRADGTCSPGPAIAALLSQIMKPEESCIGKLGFAARVDVFP